ncbi:hypothetical protein OB236_01210 [Paenibacillus sp. WQ 127069]|uniref:Uncharacterized protein n=1 Tax=Paenibacillus baimaensis TaxID=2982185 RepID=A0ABT2U883_9BACL|nr:hypothetical protein [Paenibacillus sp. WQ 127069]MCU6790732.1 hypothetical protein [Paenibacillus sp. WQ 127069]
MDELLQAVEKNIMSTKSNIERNKKYYKYPFTTNCDHYYTLILLQNRLDKWENFKNIILSFKNSHCTPVNKKSDILEKTIAVEKSTVPGFISRKTETEMLAYIKVLEWKIDDLQGIWLTSPPS